MKRINLKGTIVASEDKWIYDWFGIEAVSPKDIETQLADANGDEITVEVNSGGGDVLAGTEIYYLIASYTSNVTIDIMFAGSAASYVVTAGNKARIVPTGMIMIHNVSGGAQGDYNAMDQESKVLKAFNKSISNAYRLKTGMTESDLLNLMNKETWMPAQDALAKGFVDEIIGDSEGILSNPTPIAIAIYNGVGIANIISKDVLNKFRGAVKNPAISNSDPAVEPVIKPLVAKPAAAPTTNTAVEPEAEPTTEPATTTPEAEPTAEPTTDENTQTENLKQSLLII